MPEKQIAVVWASTVPHVQNTTRYQRAKTLTKEYDCDFFLIAGDIPDEISSQAAVETQSRTGILGAFWFLLSTIYTITLANNNEYDAIHTSYHNRAAFVGFVVSFAGIRWVHDIWDHPRLGLPQSWRAAELSTLHYTIVKTALYRTVYSSLERPDLIVLALHPDFTEVYDIDGTDTVSVPNGTDLSLYEGFEERGNDQFSIVYVGAVAESRGINTVLQSVASIDDEIENLSLVLVGDIHNKTHLTESIERYNLNESTKIMGRVPHQQALRMIADANVGLCLFPHLEEVEYIYPIKIFEYMALGTVPVSSELTGTASIIENGENGFLVTPGDPKEAADAVREVYQSDMEPVTRAAQHDVKKYDWSNINERFVDAVDSIVGE